MAQTVKRLSTMWETWVRSLGWEDPLEEGTATHSSIFAGESSWTGDLSGLQSMGFSRQGYWSGLPFPSLKDLPNLGMEPGSHTLQADALPSEPPRKPGMIL